ncbi:MAG: DUF58 domain-containing protein [Anaerolineae bacterium]|nr:DUF58 domain-containing protein [Anaerolineae bacterium]
MTQAGTRTQNNKNAHPGTPQDEVPLSAGSADQNQRPDDLTLFNDAWIALALLCILIGALSRQVGLALLGLLLLTVLPVARLWNHFALRRVLYARQLEPRRAFIGEMVDLTLTVENRKLLPLGWLVVEDEWPEDLHLAEKQQDLHPLTPGRQILKNSFSLRWYERVRLHYKIQCEQRGFFRLGPARMTSGDIFGIFKRQYLFPDIHWLIVYPKVLPIDQLGLPSKNPFGEIRSRERIFEDPARTVGVRDHFSSDGFRHIHWKATARKQDLQVKVYEPTTSFTLMVFLNVATLERYWMGTIPNLLERCISVAASVSSYAVDQKWVTGLIVNGCVPHSDQPIKVLPGRDPQQLTRILEALAAVRPVATLHIEQLLTRQSPRLPWGATLVVITGIVSEELGSTLLRLHHAGRRLVLISLAQQPPDPLLSEQILTYHLPKAASDYYPLQTAAIQQIDDIYRRDRVLAPWAPLASQTEEIG